MLKRNLKSSINIMSSLDISKYFSFYEYLYKNNPVAFAYFPHNLKELLFKAM